MRTISAQHGTMRTRDSGATSSSMRPSSSRASRRRSGDGNGLKRADGCLILEPDVPTLIAPFKGMDALAGADAHAFGERTDDR